MLWTLWRKWQEVVAREEGQDLAEYGLIIALVAIVAIGALTLLGRNISSTLSRVARSI